MTYIFSALVGVSLLGLFPYLASAQTCSDMDVWDWDMGMCMPLASKDMPMQMLMLNANAFLTGSFSERPRGRDALTIPNMFMIDAGTTIGDSHYLNLDFMGTFEKWTYPASGYPELLQVGEADGEHRPYRDAQHPHSSPIMGLTLSDTINLKRGQDHLKFWFAPRGQSTDGPTAFMHRPTGMVNPDAPLGHHVGQDVGHISSTVLGSSIRLRQTTVEFSGFNGTEPQPTRVDLPVGPLNSLAGRFIQEFDPHFALMASGAYVNAPEPDEPGIDHLMRYSISVYNQIWFGPLKIYHALIWGEVRGLDHTTNLDSFNEEFWLNRDAHNVWGRLEILQRTEGELQTSVTNQNVGHWVTAVTIGYTYEILRMDSLSVGLGASVTKDFLPSVFREAYGGDPVSAKVFLRASGAAMIY